MKVGIQIDKPILLILDSRLLRNDCVCDLRISIRAHDDWSRFKHIPFTGSPHTIGYVVVAFEFHRYVCVISRAFGILRYSYAAGLFRRLCACANYCCGILANIMRCVITVRLRWSHKTRRTAACAISTRRRSGTCRAVITTT